MVLLHVARLPMLAVALLGFSGGMALAQGTPEQREACTPDALKLCQDTIPDVAKTEACMRRHEAELSPRCHAAFIAPAAPTEPRRAARAAPQEREGRPEPQQRRHARAEVPDDDERGAAPRRLGPPETDEREAGGPPDAYGVPGPEPRRFGAPGPYGRDADAGPPDGYDEPWPGPRGYGPGPGPYGGRFADGGPPDGYDGAGPRGDGPPGPGQYGGRFADRGAPDDRGPPDIRRYHYGGPDVGGPGGGGRRARIVLRRLCAQDMIDPRTCALVRRALAEER